MKIQDSKNNKNNNNLNKLKNRNNLLHIKALRPKPQFTDSNNSSRQSLRPPPKSIPSSLSSWNPSVATRIPKSTLQSSLLFSLLLPYPTPNHLSTEYRTFKKRRTLSNNSYSLIFRLLSKLLKTSKSTLMS